MTELPERFKAPRLAVYEDVMPTGWLGELGQWLDTNRTLFIRGGDNAGGRFNYELPGVDLRYQPIADLRKNLLARVPEATDKFDLPNFHPAEVLFNAALHHHGSFQDWAKDEAPALAFALYMTADPVMFSGGELEFLDGTTVAPSHNRLVIFEATQPRRVRLVECWSSAFLHGRWSIAGLIK